MPKMDQNSTNSSINFLVIEGNIGTGKTSLAQMISRDYNAQLVLEQFSDNPFLEKFYESPNENAFPLEMSFMAERYSQMMKELQNRNLFTNFAVSDYYFMKSLIFASVTLKNDEYNLYRKFFDIIYSRLPRPDLYIYLHKNSQNLKKQINLRGRSYELGIEEDYLKKIDKAYYQYFQQQLEFPIVIIDTNDVDFVQNTHDYEKLCEKIFKNSYKVGISRVLL